MSDLNQQAFEVMGRASASGSKVSNPFFRSMVEKVTPTHAHESIDWAADADWAQLQQEPLRARWLLRMAGVVLLLLLIWAGVSEIDEVTRGDAKVVPPVRCK